VAAAHRAAPRARLLAVASPQCRNVLEQSGATHDLDGFVDESIDLDRLWELEHNQWITSQLMLMLEREFTPSTWHAFLYLVVDQKSPREAAESLGMTINAVLIAKSRVLRRFREELRGLTD
jgi:RNA polymerase sigma-70 factor (ECF subfamily)